MFESKEALHSLRILRIGRIGSGFLSSISVCYGDTSVHHTDNPAVANTLDAAVAKLQ